MELGHIIGGKRVRARDSNFEVVSPFENRGYSVEFDLPRFPGVIRRMLNQAMDNSEIPSVETRSDILDALTCYGASESVLQAYAAMTGKPVSWVANRLQDGLEMVERLKTTQDMNGRGKTSFVSLPPNDPMEPLFFLAHAVLAGSPTTIKVSSREPLLTYDIITQTLRRTPDIGKFIHVIYGDTERESPELLNAMERVQCPILMGATDLRLEHKIEFHADRSRALVLDVEAAIPYLRDSIMAPDSCLAARNYIVVGEEQYERLAAAIRAEYAGLVHGNILEEETTGSLFEREVMRDAKDRVNMGRMWGNTQLIYPDSGKLGIEDFERGVILKLNTGAFNVKPNPFFWRPVPEAYVTAITVFETVDAAIEGLRKAQMAMMADTDGRYTKHMAGSVFAREDQLNGGKIEKRFGGLVYHLHVNQSPMYVEGAEHQGIVMQRELRGVRG